MQQIYSVIQTSRSEGMITMNEALSQLTELDLIPVSTALRRSPRPKELMAMMQYRENKK